MYSQFYQMIRMVRPRELRTLRYTRELERNQWLSQDELEHIEWQRLKRLLDHAYANVPFYRQRFDQMDITPAEIQTREDFYRLPLLSKDDLRLHADELIARNYPRSRLRRDTTSGSTGIPIVVYHDDARYVPVKNAAYIRSRRWFGVEPGDKVAWIWGRRDDLPPNTWSGRLINALKRERWLNAFRVSDEEMRSFAEMLVKWQPDYLVGYPTSTFLFARCVSDHHISGIHLKGIETTAGTLWPHERQEIEKTFGCRVHDRYGSHEIGHVAAECEYGRMHIFCDVCTIEVLTGGMPAPEGEVGEMVVTPLESYGMPLIRFRIGDVGMLDTRPCPCGRGLPVLRELVGRTNSVITLPSGKYLYGGIFLTILEDVLEIHQFRVHQPAKDRLEITLQKGNGFSQETLERVRGRVITLLRDEPIEVSILATDEPLSTVSGKYLVTNSDVPVSL